MAAAATKKPARQGDIRQFCTFWLAGRLYGVDILDVKEVNQELRFTPVFHAPREVKGYVNIRGRIHLILDLRRVLGMREAPLEEKNRLVIFKPVVGESFGVLVDAISDVVETPAENIESGSLASEELPAEERGEAGGLVSGVCRLKDALLLIIDARQLPRVVERALA